jgi:hypothetical protein
MDINLDREQRAQLEMIALHVGKPPAQVLMDAAVYLLSRDGRFLESLEGDAPPESIQTFLNDGELNARFTRMLRR